MPHKSRRFICNIYVSKKYSRKKSHGLRQDINVVDNEMFISLQQNISIKYSL